MSTDLGKEAIVTVVGFLGAGKTTLLKHLMNSYLEQNWNPFIILNDYENAGLDIQQFSEINNPEFVKPLSGSCICCSGINELRDFINRVPDRKNGITLIEANGTSDACSLMGFLGVGINNRFLPPIQISVVDTKNWQTRGEHNELEANQVQVSSLIVLTHTETCSEKRILEVSDELKRLNPLARITKYEEINISEIPVLHPSENSARKLDHLKAHWSSASINLPDLPSTDCIQKICDALPKSILRVKGCTRIGSDESYTYFERTPDMEIRMRPFNGVPVTGAKLLTVGPGSDALLLQKAIKNCLFSPQSTEQRFQQTTRTDFKQ